MARFVVNLGFRPEEYYRLTLGERNAIVVAWNKQQQRR